MQAIVYERYGSPEVLELREIEIPAPKADEVLVRVKAVSINDWDWANLQGSLVNRLLWGVSKPRFGILGSDVAGRIEAIGSNVTEFHVGEDVYGDLSGPGPWGGFAEYICAREKALRRKPGTMTFEQAASIPQAAMLAVQALIDVGEIQRGQRVLINGAGGGFGTFAVQIAKAHDTDVTGVDSAGKLDMLRAIGCDHVIDYAREDFTRNGKQYDLIVDAKTNRSPVAYARSLASGGIYATVGGAMPRLLQIFVFGRAIARADNKRLRVVALKANKDLAYIETLFESGRLVPVIDGHYTLERTAEAMRYFASGAHKGKLVITAGGVCAT